MPMRFPLNIAPRKGFRNTGRDFGASRGKERQHAGVDLLATIGTDVFAMADGVTGEYVPRFYTKSDQAIAIIHDDITGRYCEIAVLPQFRKAGVAVKQGDKIGSVSVLTEHNASMLHLEMYRESKRVPLTVRTNAPYDRAGSLIDPRPILEQAAATSGIVIPISVAMLDEGDATCTC